MNLTKGARRHEWRSGVFWSLVGDALRMMSAEHVTLRVPSSLVASGATDAHGAQLFT
jgi:hypothetical protein